MKLLSTILFIILLSSAVFPCGSTQVLYGLVHDDGFPVSGAIVQVSIQGTVIDEIQTGPFGMYSSVVGPCPEAHLLSVTHRRYVFQSVPFWTDGSGDAININVGVE